MSRRDYYEVLGLSRSASADEIKSAYRKLAQKFHPDRNKAADAADRFNEVQEAYKVLSDKDARKQYDRFGHVPSGAGAHARPEASYTWSNVGGRPRGGSGGGGFGFDASSIFEDMFGGGGSPFGARSARTKPRATPKTTATVTVPFDTAIRGGEIPLRVDGPGGSETIDVQIPRGTGEGARLRVKSDGTRGDLILTVSLAKHPVFTRQGLDLSLELPLTIAEATLGTDVTIPTLTDTGWDKIDLSVPRGTPSGSRLRLKGRGVIDASGKRGDLYAVVKIVPPKSLNTEDEQSLRAMSDRLPNPRTGGHWP